MDAPTTNLDVIRKTNAIKAAAWDLLMAHTGSTDGAVMDAWTFCRDSLTANGITNDVTHP